MQTIDRTFRILELYLQDNYELSISEISEKTGLSPSVAHRVATSLVQKRLPDAERKKRKIFFRDQISKFRLYDPEKY